VSAILTSIATDDSPARELDTTADYRDSHAERGGDYDARIAATPFDAYLARVEAAHLEEVFRDVIPQPIGRSLDFACGTGRIAVQVEPHVHEAYGVDVSASMLEQARRKCRWTTFIEADITRERLSCGPFDVVTAFRFFGNAEDDLRTAALRAIHDLLVPGGFLVLNNHRNPSTFSSWLHRASGGVEERDLTHSKLGRQLEEAGFRVVRRRAIGFWIYRSKLAVHGLDGVDATSARERWFAHAVFAPWAPDAILVAQKASS